MQIIKTFNVFIFDKYVVYKRSKEAYKKIHMG